jgi:hypothetical protein
LRFVAKLIGPGINPSINAAAVIPPTICEMNKRIARKGVITWAIANANEIAGLNNAPETRKKTHTLIINDIPNESEMNRRLEVLMNFSPFAEVIVAPWRFAIWVPPKERRRNNVVPTYSPI